MHNFAFVGGGPLPPPIEIPTLNPVGIGLLALLLGTVGVLGLRRRSGDKP